MLVDTDDLRAKIINVKRETGEELAGKDEPDEDLLQFRLGELAGYTKVEMMLDELEEAYRNQGLEHIRSMREE